MTPKIDTDSILNPETMPRADVLKALKPFASSDETRPNLMAIHADCLRTWATDGARLAIDLNPHPLQTRTSYVYRSSDKTWRPECVTPPDIDSGIVPMSRKAVFAFRLDVQVLLQLQGHMKHGPGAMGPGLYVTPGATPVAGITLPEFVPGSRVRLDKRKPSKLNRPSLKLEVPGLLLESEYSSGGSGPYAVQLRYIVDAVRFCGLENQPSVDVYLCGMDALEPSVIRSSDGQRLVLTMPFRL